MRRQEQTKPCEQCGQPVTKTAAQQSQRKYWTCNPSCANKLRISLGHTPAWKPNPLRGQKETRPCVQCGKPVTRYLSEISAGRGWACSRTCKAIKDSRSRVESGTWKRPQRPRTGAEHPCPVCGTPVYSQPKQVKQFCSRACAYQAVSKEPVVKQCSQCGKELRLKPSQGMRQFCSKACDAAARVKRPMDRIHNGRPAKQDKAGYVMLWEPTHPNTSMKGWQYEHRLVMERQLGRLLRSDEQVDHINQVKDDNRPENLQVLSASGHSAKTVKDLWGGIATQRDELAEYRRRFGPLVE